MVVCVTASVRILLLLYITLVFTYIYLCSDCGRIKWLNLERVLNVSLQNVRVRSAGYVFRIQQSKRIQYVLPERVGTRFNRTCSPEVLVTSHYVSAERSGQKCRIRFQNSTNVRRQNVSPERVGTFGQNVTRTSSDVKLFIGVAATILV